MKTRISISFAKGFYRVLDLSGTKKWPKLSNNRKTDYEAIRRDWENVGRAIEREARIYRQNGSN